MGWIRAFYSRRSRAISAGIAFLVVGLGMVFFYTEPLPVEQKQSLIELKLFKSSDRTYIGKKILLQGTLSEKNVLLIHDIVIGCKQVYSGGYKHGRWNTRDTYNQDFKLDIGKGQQVTVIADSPCPNDDYTKIDDPTNESNIQWVGYKRGSLMTVVGQVALTKPFSVTTDQHFGGSRKDYLSSLDSDKTRTHIIGFVSVFGGLILMIWGFRMR